MLIISLQFVGKMAYSALTLSHHNQFAMLITLSIFSFDYPPQSPPEMIFIPNDHTMQNMI